MKKVWQVIFVLLMLAFHAKAQTSFDPETEKWVDSLYQRLTLSEKIGQLIDLRIAPTPSNILELESLIRSYDIGAITITGGDARTALTLIKRLQKSLKVPVFVTAENQHTFMLPGTAPSPVPLPSTFVVANDAVLLKNTFQELSSTLSKMSIKSVSFNPSSLVFTQSGFEIHHAREEEKSLLTDLPQIYQENKFSTVLPFRFAFDYDSIFSSKQIPNWNSSDWKSMTGAINEYWSAFNHPLTTLTLKEIPYMQKNDAQLFHKKVVNPLLWKHLQFSGLLAADFDHIIENSFYQSDPETATTLLRIGSDKIITSNRVGALYKSILMAVSNKEIKQSEINEKVKRNLILKYLAGVGQEPYLLHEDHVETVLQSPELKSVAYEVYKKAMSMDESVTGILPLIDVDYASFASLTLGFSDNRVFQETLEKYAPFVHFMVPDASFNPYDLNTILEQLIQFDYLVIGLHTNNLASFDQNVIDFLKNLNANTKVILVFLGKEINHDDLAEFPVRIRMHEDNEMTQRIAVVKIFGADNLHLGRLSYSMPEMQGMDSRVLRKIDKVAQEAIRIGATPGCQLVVARNGSVILEKAYGYYTYDSIMEVDSRTIYDLASITKVAATTQAVMKLAEQDQIELDNTLAFYLPELNGTNKQDLTVRDVLAHQSGLRPFYPFWLYTTGKTEQKLQYYKRYPDPDFSNTVAYGMFAGENLKDSIWHWTIDTKLRPIARGQAAYDYKYSDLGFFMLQNLVERVAGTSLDAYVDSVFYKPMGMSTMTFNPLCKFQLNQITPTEMDENFRQVLVWGTVHDQVAAMKGGVSGHAGLFSNAHDVAKMLQMQLQKGHYSGIQFLDPTTIDQFTSYNSGESRRGLGWDKPEKKNDVNPVSRWASHESFGHSGFTGTLAWADPTFNLVFVFLSNRVYPKAENTKLSDFQIRRRIQDLVYESIWSFEKGNN